MLFFGILTRWNNLYPISLVDLHLSNQRLYFSYMKRWLDRHLETNMNLRKARSSTYSLRLLPATPLVQEVQASPFRDCNQGNVLNCCNMGDRFRLIFYPPMLAVQE